MERSAIATESDNSTSTDPDDLSEMVTSFVVAMLKSSNNPVARSCDTEVKAALKHPSVSAAAGRRN
jgi:hypothetical protein